jgi:hypothetical protein
VHPASNGPPLHRAAFNRAAGFLDFAALYAPLFARRKR